MIWRQKEYLFTVDANGPRTKNKVFLWFRKKTIKTCLFSHFIWHRKQKQNHILKCFRGKLHTSNACSTNNLHTFLDLFTCKGGRNLINEFRRLWWTHNQKMKFFKNALDYLWKQIIYIWHSLSCVCAL